MILLWRALKKESITEPYIKNSPEKTSCSLRVSLSPSKILSTPYSLIAVLPATMAHINLITGTKNQLCVLGQLRRKDLL